MSRSIWKGPFSDLKVIKTVNKSASNKSIPSRHKDKRRDIITVWSRRSQILPAQVDKKFLVHNGRTFINVKCTQSMCSRKYGEFAVTRKKASHKLNKRKQLHKNVR